MLIHQWRAIRPPDDPLVTSQMLIAAAALRIGEVEMATKAFNPTMTRQFETAARLDSSLHGILDHAPFAPRRRDAVLVWPLEVPMMDPSVHRLFRGRAGAS